MKKSQVLATLAFALTLGLAVPVANIFALEEAPAVVTESENGEEQTEQEANRENNNEEDDDESDSEGAPAEQAGGGMGGSDEGDGMGGIAEPENPVEVTGEASLQANLDDDTVDYIKLTADITLNSPITINRAADKYIQIDLNGHTVTSTVASNARLFVVEKGNVSISNGIIDASTNTGGIGIKIVGQAADANGSTDGSYVNVDNVTIKAGNNDVSYGVAIYQKPNTNQAANTYFGSYNSTIEAPNGAAGITVLGSIQDPAAYPSVYITDSTVEGQDAGIYAAGKSNLYVMGGSKIKGATGIATKAGVITVDDGSIVEGIGAFQEPSTNNNGFTPAGVGIQIESNGAYAGKVEVHIYGENTIVKSANGPAIFTYGEQDKVDATVQEITYTNESQLVAGGGHKAVEGVPEGKFNKIDEPTYPGQGGDDKKEDKKTDEKTPPNTGVVAESTGTARTTAGVLSAIATALTAAGAGIIAYRNSRRNAKKNQ